MSECKHKFIDEWLENGFSLALCEHCRVTEYEVALKARVAELENCKAQVLAMSVGYEVPNLLPYLRSEWAKVREQAKTEGGSE